MDFKYRSYSTEQYFVMQPTAHNTGDNADTDKNAADVWVVADQSSAKNPAIAKGAESTLDGDLVVHLVADPADVWCTLKLEAGVPKGAIFDMVDVGESTAGLFAAGVLQIWL
jgi:hypothetical protein